MRKTVVMYLLACTGYFGLFILHLLWHSVLSPPTLIPKSVALAFFLIPLLFPLRGILQARPYTFAWSSFLSLLYITHGIMEAYSSDTDQRLAWIEIVLACLFYVGAMFFARWGGRELKERDAAEDKSE